MTAEPNTATKRKEEKDKPKGFIELIKWEPKFRVELIALIVGFLVLVIYFLQWRVMQNSLTVDERAWLKVSLTEKMLVVENSPVITSIMVTNAGKTPAKDISFLGIVEIVPNGEAPRFDITHNVDTFTAKLLFPGETVSPPIEVKTLQPGGLYAVAKPLSHEDYQRLAKGQAWIAVYGKIMYTDFFRESRWVNFCGWNSPSKAPVSARSCSDFNDMN